MERVGVDGAILVSPGLCTDMTLITQRVFMKFPNKFRLVRPVDTVGEIIQEWAKNKGAVAIRLMLTYEEQRNSVVMA